jgi:hypothetical protein
MNLTQQLEQSKQLSELWTALIDGHVPTQRQFLIWLSMYDVPIVEKGVLRCAIWSSKNPGKADEDHVRYASGVMANTKRDGVSGSYDGRAVSHG